AERRRPLAGGRVLWDDGRDVAAPLRAPSPRLPGRCRAGGREVAPTEPRQNDREQTTTNSSERARKALIFQGLADGTQRSGRGGGGLKSCHSDQHLAKIKIGFATPCATPWCCCENSRLNSHAPG